MVMLDAHRFKDTLLYYLFVCTTKQSKTKEAFFNHYFHTQMELTILRGIEYKLSSPSSIDFLNQLSAIAALDAMEHTMAKYLCEESVLFYPMLKYLPSTIAAAAVLIARLALHRTPLWDDTMRHYIGLDATDVLPCARELTRCIQTQRVKLASHIGHPLCSVKRKYDSEKLYRVGSIELPSETQYEELSKRLSRDYSF